MSNWTLGSVVTLAAVGEIGEVISTDRGESEKVARLQSHPDHLIKIYKSNAPAVHDKAPLDHLIQLPSQMSSTDKAVVGNSCAWPLSRVVEGGRTRAVILPLAPPIFKATFQTSRGATERYLEVDWLSVGPAHYNRSKLAAPDANIRLLVAIEIAQVAALLERHGLVYADWSYVNAFWSARPARAFMLDMDGIAQTSRARITTQNWDDPLTPLGVRADTYTDRYGLALIVSRCLTGERTLPLLDQATRVPDQPGLGPAYRLLRKSLFSQDRLERPSAQTLFDLLSAALKAKESGKTQNQRTATSADDGHNVKSWRQVSARGPRSPHQARPQTPNRPPTRQKPAGSAQSPWSPSNNATGPSTPGFPSQNLGPPGMPRPQGPVQPNNKRAQPTATTRPGAQPTSGVPNSIKPTPPTGNQNVQTDTASVGDVVAAIAVLLVVVLAIFFIVLGVASIFF